MPIAPDWPTLAALALIAFAGSIVYGVTGFGSALVTIPLATHLVPLPFALAMFAVVDLANALRVGFENPRHAVKGEAALFSEVRRRGRYSSSTRRPTPARPDRAAARARRSGP